MMFPYLNQIAKRQNSVLNKEWGRHVITSDHYSISSPSRPLVPQLKLDSWFEEIKMFWFVFIKLNIFLSIGLDGHGCKNGEWSFCTRFLPVKHATTDLSTPVKYMHSFSCLIQQKIQYVWMTFVSQKHDDKTSENEKPVHFVFGLLLLPYAERYLWPFD